MRSGFLVLALVGCGFDAPDLAVDGPVGPDAAPEILDGAPTEPDGSARPVCDPAASGLLVCFSFTTLTSPIANEGTLASADATASGVTQEMRDGAPAVGISAASSIRIPGNTGIAGIRTIEMVVRIAAEPAVAEQFGLVDVPGAASLFYQRFEDRRSIRFSATPLVELEATLPSGTWVHLARVCGTDGMLRGYVDGVERVAEEGCVAGSAGSNAVAIGQNEDGGTPTDHTLGAIDDVRIWSRALDAGELSARASASGARR